MEIQLKPVKILEAGQITIKDGRIQAAAVVGK